MNRRKINTVTITLFVICAIAAIVCAWMDHDRILSGDSRTYPYALGCVALTFVIGIVRFALLLKARKTEKAEYVPIRSVKLENGTEVNNGVEQELVEKAVLIHTDNVDDDKVIVRVFKDQVPVVDYAGKVNKN